MNFSPIITNYQQQGKLTVNTNTELNNIPIYQRKEGMLVLVIDDNGTGLVKEYKMALGSYSDDLLDNENWLATNIFSIPIYFDTEVLKDMIIPTSTGIIEIYENINDTGLFSLLSYNGGDYYIGVQNNLFLISFPRIMKGCIKFKNIDIA